MIAQYVGLMYTYISEREYCGEYWITIPVDIYKVQLCTDTDLERPKIAHQKCDIIYLSTFGF